MTNGVLTKDWTYDSQGRVDGVLHFADTNDNQQYDVGTDTLFDKSTYMHAKDGNRLSESRENADGTTDVSWTYDGLQRLVKETFDGVDADDNALVYTDEYVHDLLGNRLSKSHTQGGTTTTTASTFDASDRLRTSTTGGVTTTHAYSTGGTELASKSSSSSTTTYQYDVMGRTKSVTVDGTTVEYEYNTNGIRVSRTEGGQTTVYHLDPMNPTGYAQVLEEGEDTNANGKLDAAEVERAFTLGLQILAQATSTDVHRLLTDAHGTTRVLLDAATATIDELYTYDAYGNPLGFTIATAATPILYAAQWLDPLTGLSYNRARWYDPSTGRWTRTDDFRPGPGNTVDSNLWGYVGGNPVNAVDPSGQFYSLAVDLLVSTGIRALVFAAIGGVSVGGYFKYQGLSFWRGAFVGGLLGASISLSIAKKSVGPAFASGISGAVAKTFLTLFQESVERGNPFVFDDVDWGRISAEFIEHFTYGYSSKVFGKWLIDDQGVDEDLVTYALEPLVASATSITKDRLSLNPPADVE